jgi:hypothetical protein
LIKLLDCPCGEKTVSYIVDDQSGAKLCDRCYPIQDSNVVRALEKMNSTLRLTGSLQSYPRDEQLRNLRGDWSPIFQHIDIDLGSCRISFNGPRFEFASRTEGNRTVSLIDYGSPVFIFVDSAIFNAEKHE